jgi:hypothetical protein
MDRRKVEKIGMIVDEAQNLPQSNKEFFRTDFMGWGSLSSAFPSQLCASALGLYEFYGEYKNRVRYVTPFKLTVAHALITRKDSPFYIRNEKDSLIKDILVWFGGVPFQLFGLGNELRSAGKKNSRTILRDEITSTRDHYLHLFYTGFYKEKCEKNELDSAGAFLERLFAKDTNNLVALKTMYDQGIVYVDPDSKRLILVNRVAEVALQAAYAKESSKTVATISFESDRKLQGPIFEKQVLQQIQNRGALVHALKFTSPDGPPVIQLPLSSTATFIFDDIVEMLQNSSRSERVLWKPRNAQYVCNGTRDIV